MQNIFSRKFDDFLEFILFCDIFNVTNDELYALLMDIAIYDNVDKSHLLKISIIVLAFLIVNRA